MREELVAFQSGLLSFDTNRLNSHIQKLKLPFSFELFLKDHTFWNLAGASYENHEEDDERHEGDEGDEVIALPGDFNAGSARVLWAPKCFSSSWRSLLRSLGPCTVQLKMTEHRHYALSARNMKNEKLLCCDGLTRFLQKHACMLLCYLQGNNKILFVSWQIGWCVWTVATLYWRSLDCDWSKFEAWTSLADDVATGCILQFADPNRTLGTCPWSMFFKPLIPWKKGTGYKLYTN